MNYRIEDTRLPGRTVCVNDTTRPFAVVADRSFNPVIGRYTTKAAARRKIKDLKR